MIHDTFGRALRTATIWLSLVVTPALAHSGHSAAAGSTIAAGTCSAEDMAVITETFAEAKRRLQQAITFIAERPDHPHVRRWFGSASPKLIHLHLQMIAAGVENTGRYALQCRDPEGCKNDAFAYANPYDWTLGFCRNFFRAGDSGRDARFGIVVHEVSHIAIRARDAAYFPANTEKLARDEPGIAATNAESYEHFVEFLPAS